MGRVGVGRRLSPLLVALVAVSSGLAVSTSVPVAAQEPSDPVDEPPAEEPAVAVTPSSGLHDGDVVEVELTGFTGHFVAVATCPVSVQDGGILPLDILGCGSLSDVRYRDVTTSPEAIPGGLPIREWIGSSRVHCAARPGACLVVAAAATPGGPVAVTPIDVVPSPLTLQPSRGVVGTTVKAHVGGEPGAAVTVAQCARPVGASLDASSCAAGVPLVLDEHGVGSVDVVLAQTVETPAGSVSCIGGRCGIATFDAAGNRLAAQDVAVTAADPIRVSVVSPSSSEGLVDGQEIELEVTGRPEIPLTLAQCNGDVPRDSNVEDGPCQVIAELGPAGPGTDVRRARVAVHRELTLSDGTTVDCLLREDTGCWLVVEGDDGGEFHTLLLDFVPVSVSPSSGLLDGQAMTVEGRGLEELVETGFSELRLIRCRGLAPTDVEDGLPYAELDGDRCEDPAAAPVARLTPEGMLSTTFPASQRFQAANGGHHYCRADCQVGLSVSVPSVGGLVFLPSGYAMAEALLSVSPALVFEDGQPVTVTGHQLMPEYDGPPIWFLESGAWSLLQCRVNVLENRTVLGIFQGCAVLPPGSVPVTGPDLSLEVVMQGQRTAILGDRIDCRSGPGACVVMLARLEQDGSISTHSASISFVS